MSRRCHAIRLGRLLHVAVLTALAVWNQPAFAAVTHASLQPTVKVFRGDCPAKLVFNGSITVNAPGTVQYIFTRSDGATDTLTKTLAFTRAGTKPVSTTWTLGGAWLPHYAGWQAVKILGRGGIESVHADFEVFCDPPKDSAKAAHGNTDWHIDTANEFLFGKDMSNNSTAANFAPAGWTKTHVHVGLSNTAHYYGDKAKVTAADDADLSQGIDKTMLFFYAGHGNATTWNTLGDNGHQTAVLLGNPDGGGQLRYFWQCSCEVFAHGPLVCSGSDCDYSQPESFDGSADSASMRNVFERWGPAIGNDLRMACGVSTLAYCHEGNVNKIWDDYNNKSMSVAESFIDGLGGGSVKPLCITRGGPDITQTPLYDDTFSHHHNASGNTYLHIMYAGGTQTDPPEITLRPELIPHKLYRVRLVKPGDPPEFRRKLIRVQRIEQLRDAQLAGGSAVVRRDPTSGAVHLRAVARPQGPPSATPKTDAALRQTAVDFVRGLGWLGDDVGTIQVKKILTTSMPVGGKAADITKGEKGAIVTLRRRLRTGDLALDTRGDGGRVDLMLGRDGQILNVVRTWRQATVTREEMDIKPYDRALEEAQGRLRLDANGYKLAGWRFGYDEAAANVEQQVLSVVYEFDFVPRDRERLIDYPPQRIRVDAEAK
jgi:hypothetical protein